MMDSLFPEAREAAMAINTYMANWGDKESPYQNAKVAELARLSVVGAPAIWIARLEPHAIGMHELSFIVANGRAILIARDLYTAHDLGLVSDRGHESEQATSQEGGVA